MDNSSLPGFLLLLCNHVVRSPNTPTQIVDKTGKKEDIGTKNWTWIFRLV